MTTNERTGHKTKSSSEGFFSLVGSMASKLLGENTFAKSAIAAERVANGAHSSLDRPLDTGLALADFQLTKQSQLGYLIAVKDLMAVTFDQFTFMIEWAMGEQTPEIVNRAAGPGYHDYLRQVDDSQAFTAGYRTAVIHFVHAIAGEGGFIPEFENQLDDLSFEQTEWLVNDWFDHVDQYLHGIYPFQKLASTADGKIAKQLIDEYNFGFLSSYQFGDNSPILTHYEYRGPDFTDEVHLPAMMAGTLPEFQLTDAIHHFISVQVAGLFNLLLSVGLHAFYVKTLTRTNYDWLGLPLAGSVDAEKIMKAVVQNEATIIEKVGIPTSISAVAAALPIVDLHGVATTRNPENQNYQRQFMVVLDNRHQPQINVLGEPMPVNYGVFDQLFFHLQEKLLQPIFVRYILVRNQALQYFREHGHFRDGYLPAFVISNPQSLTEYVGALAVIHVKHFESLMDRGMDDHTNLTVAGSLSSFNHLMRVDEQLSSLDPDYEHRPKQTKRVLYWLYQSQFAASLPASERVTI